MPRGELETYRRLVTAPPYQLYIRQLSHLMVQGRALIVVCRDDENMEILQQIRIHGSSRTHSDPKIR